MTTKRHLTTTTTRVHATTPRHEGSAFLDLDCKRVDKVVVWPPKQANLAVWTGGEVRVTKVCLWRRIKPKDLTSGPTSPSPDLRTHRPPGWCYFRFQIPKGKDYEAYLQHPEALSCAIHGDPHC